LYDFRLSVIQQQWNPSQIKKGWHERSAANYAWKLNTGSRAVSAVFFSNKPNGFIAYYAIFIHCTSECGFQWNTYNCVFVWFIL
jgi:hypothetical protein